MDRVYVDAFSLRAPCVLGRQLLPLSLGHVLLLHGIASPFVGQRDRGAGDLARAVWICSRPASETRRAALDPKAIARDTKAWVKAAGKLDMVEQLATFEEYMAAFCKVPERWESGDLKPVKVGWPYAIAVAIRPLFGSMDEAFDQPVNHACCLKASMDALGGDTTLMSEDEREIAAKLENDDGR